MGAKLFATFTAVVGATSVIYALFAASGVEISQPLQTAIDGALGLGLVVAGIWLHPSIPVGSTPEKPPTS